MYFHFSAKFVYFSLNWHFIQFQNFLFIFYFWRMGETCSACNQKDNTTELMADVHKIPSDKDVAQKEDINHNQKIMNETIKANQKVSKVGTVVSRLGESKGYNYKKLDNGGVPLSQVPKFTTPVTEQKRSQLGQFKYDREDLEDKTAEKKGPILFENRYVYIGEWSNNQRSGRGMQIWKDGSIYQGYWKNNLAHGFGRLIHTDGDVYTGEWKNDKANGKGKYISSYGAEYFGQWKDDKQEGYGQQKWKDGAYYKGDYKAGKKQGKGTFIWGDDSSYTGQFQQNNIHGKGVYLWKDGRLFDGEWNNNKMHGKGIFTWPDGRKYEGTYQNDKKHGFGVFTFRDGRIYEGQWENGKQHGRGIYRKKKISREGIWENGIRVRWLDNKENEESSDGKKDTNI